VVSYPVVSYPVVVGSYPSGAVYASAQPQVRTVVTQRNQDSSLVPQTEREKAAVRDALKQLRQPPEAGDKGNSFVNQGENERKAEITVHLPANARLYVDNVPCPLTSSKRTFKTPELEPGKKYFYILRAEVVQNGQTLSENLRVILIPGQQVRVEFTNLTPQTRTVQR